MSHRFLKISFLVVALTQLALASAYCQGIPSPTAPSAKNTPPAKVGQVLPADWDAYSKWMASIPADQQAWEKLLQKYLGGYYFPLYLKGRLGGKYTLEEPGDWGFVPDNPALPRVLLIGDSISHMYTDSVRKLLKGKANVHRAPANCGPTDLGLKGLDDWLGTGPWDVIYFNFGLHDRRKKDEQYRANLEWIVRRLEQTGATLIWARTTPSDCDPAAPGQIRMLNEVADGVMKRHNIRISDLFGPLAPVKEKYINADRMHFNSEGVRLLAEMTGKSIAEALQAPKRPVATGASEPGRRKRAERLYNGIVLPEAWPPRTINPRDTAPMPVPYLASRPAVVPIDVGRQLFVDDFLIETSGLKRVFHLPTKYEGNPVLKPETALEINAGGDAAAVPKSGGVWWDPAEKIFKMWYEAGWLHTICYATSKDGLKWERPALDVNPGTNQVLPPDLRPDSWTVVPDWEAKDPAQRYKMFMRPPGDTQPGVCMTSADGIHWTHRVMSGKCGDRSTMFYNPFRKKWVFSLRSGWRGRSRHYWECDDFLADAQWGMDDKVMWAAVDRDDLKDPVTQREPQLYNLDAVAYESLMLGFFELHHGPENDVCEKTGLPKITELNFAYSRDGFHWYRPDRRAHIPAARRDAWDRGYVQSLGNLCCVRGDTLWFYYSGFRGDASKANLPPDQNGMYDRGATSLAFLRRDGFASLEAGAKAAVLTTRPVTFSGGRVFVNAATAGGELRVEILDQAGRPIAPYTFANCRPIAADSTLESVTWSGAEDVAALNGRPVRFRFTLRQGALYAFWVSRDATGRSDGYVAGGGPGFTGMTDTVGRAALVAERGLGLRMGPAGASD